MKVFPPPRAHRGLRSRTAHYPLADGGAHLYRACARRMGDAAAARRICVPKCCSSTSRSAMTVLALVVLRIVVAPRSPARRPMPSRSAELTHAAAQRGASRALCLDDRDAGQRLSDRRPPAATRPMVRPVQPSEISWARTSPRRGGEPGALCVRLDHRVRAGRASWRGRLACGDQARPMLTRMWPRYRPQPR